MSDAERVERAEKLAEAEQSRAAQFAELDALLAANPGVPLAQLLAGQ